MIRNIARNLLDIFTGIVEGILGLRFVFKLFGANATTGFVSWVYEMSDVLLQPFRAIFPTTIFENRFVLEFSTLFAMVIYSIAALLLASVIATITAAETPLLAKKHR